MKMGEPPEMNIDLRVQVDNLTWVLHWAHKDNEMLGEQIKSLKERVEELLAKEGYEEYYVNDLREQNKEFRGMIIDMQSVMDEGENQVKNLQLRNEHQSIRIKSLESELDGLRLVELDMSMTEEEEKIYREGMEILNKDGEMTQEDIDLINSCCLTRQDIEKVVWETLLSMIMDAQSS